MAVGPEGGMKDQDHTSSILKAFTSRSLSCLFFAEEMVEAVLSASMMGGGIVMRSMHMVFHAVYEKGIEKSRRSTPKTKQ